MIARTFSFEWYQSGVYRGIASAVVSYILLFKGLACFKVAIDFPSRTPVGGVMGLSPVPC